MARHGFYTMLVFGTKLACQAQLEHFARPQPTTQLLEIIMSDIMRPVPFEGLCLQRIFGELQGQPLHLRDCPEASSIARPMIA
jgi:hypothetical protein